MAFIFDPSKGETPESLRKKREIAEALRSNAMGMASSPGEGLAMIGAAIGARRADSKANKAAAYGQQQASSAMAPILAAFGGGSPAPSKPSTPSAPTPSPQPTTSAAGGGDLKSGIAATAQSLGIDPVDLATAISYETAGTFDPTKRGPTTQWGQHRGLIQFGEPQAKQYGVNWDDPVGSQLGPDGAVAKYLRDTGVKPGMGLLDIYSAINAGGVGRYNRSDANNGGAPGTVRDKVEQQMAGHRAKALALFGEGGQSPAAQAVTAMAQGGQGGPAPAPQAVAPQMAQPQPSGDVYMRQNMVDGAAEPGKTAVPVRGGSGGGMSAILSSLLGRGQPAQPAPQQMAPQMAQPIMQDPAAYNAGVVRMSPDLSGPARQPAPQGQPPIPGLQPSAPTMQDMAGRMPAPQGQQMPQGMDALRTALQPQQAAPQQAAPRPAPVQQQAMPPQTATATPQPGANGLGLPQLLQIAQNPWVAENKLYGGIINTLIENQLSMNKPMNPMEKAQLEKLLIETEQLRNPQAKPTGDMTEYDLYAEQAQAAGEQPMSFLDYQQALRKSGATSVTTNVGEGDKFYENLDKKNAETFSALSDTGMQARSKLAQIDRLAGLLAAAPQGASAMLKQAAGEYGINTEGLSDIQAAQALINELVPQQRQPGSGPMSDADLALFKQSLPRLINQPEGNAMILDTMRGITQYQIQMGQIADAVSNREMTPAEGRKAIAGLANPLAGFGKRSSQIGRATNGGQGSSQGGAPAGLDPAVWEEMTPEEKALFQ